MVLGFKITAFSPSLIPRHTSSSPFCLLRAVSIHPAFFPAGFLVYAPPGCASQCCNRADMYKTFYVQLQRQVHHISCAIHIHLVHTLSFFFWKGNRGRMYHCIHPVWLLSSDTHIQHTSPSTHSALFSMSAGIKKGSFEDRRIALYSIAFLNEFLDDISAENRYHLLRVFWLVCWL